MTTSTFKTAAEFRAFATIRDEFTKGVAVPKTKLTNPVAFGFRGSQTVVFGFDAKHQEQVEIRITNPEFAVTPSTGVITKFSPNIFQTLLKRDHLVSSDLTRSGNVESGAGWLTKPTSAGKVFVHVSTEVDASIASQIVALLK